MTKQDKIKLLFILLNYYKIKKLNQLHALSRTQYGRQREPSAKKLRSPLSYEFWKNCVLSGGTQRRLDTRVKK